jgi:hypothetical protein
MLGYWPYATYKIFFYIFIKKIKPNITIKKKTVHMYIPEFTESLKQFKSSTDPAFRLKLKSETSPPITLKKT